VRPDPLAALRHDLEQYKQATDMKLSELNSALTPLVAQVPRIQSDVDLLKANDPELPANAAQSLADLTTGLQSLEDSAKP